MSIEKIETQSYHSIKSHHQFRTAEDNSNSCVHLRGLIWIGCINYSSGQGLSELGDETEMEDELHNTSDWKEQGLVCHC